jgi:hypothetical protein
LDEPWKKMHVRFGHRNNQCKHGWYLLRKMRT